MKYDYVTDLRPNKKTWRVSTFPAHNISSLAPVRPEQGQKYKYRLKKRGKEVSLLSQQTHLPVLRSAPLTFMIYIFDLQENNSFHMVMQLFIKIYLNYFYHCIIAFGSETDIVTNF